MYKESRQARLLKINNDGLLTADFREFIAVINILKDQTEQYPTAKKKLHIFIEKI